MSTLIARMMPNVLAPINLQRGDEHLREITGQGRPAKETQHSSLQPPTLAPLEAPIIKSCAVSDMKGGLGKCLLPSITFLPAPKLEPALGNLRKGLQTKPEARLRDGQSEVRMGKTVTMAYPCSNCGAETAAGIQRQPYRSLQSVGLIAPFLPWRLSVLSGV